MRFDDCYLIVRKLEGGYADEAHDKGGPTNYGITQDTYSNWLAAGGEHDRSVKAITEAEARDIYFEYWRECHASNLPPPVDLLVFDCAINSGPRRAIKLLQSSLGAGVDGVFGPKSFAALNEEVAAMGAAHVGEMYLQERQWWYLEIVRRDPTQNKFLRGWLNRLDHLRAYV